MEHSIAKIICVLAVATAISAACTKNPEGPDDGFTQTSHIISGKVEKGPMVRGSQIDMRTLDKNLVPTGSSYTTTIENNAGDFNFGALKVDSPYAKLTADGYFFNEVDGSLSSSTIKLDAIVDLSDNATVNVNVLTHLKSNRIVYLVTEEKKTFKEANNQAQNELLSQFGLQRYAETDASQYSITSGNEAAGALIAVSSLILSDRSEAEIVEYLSLLSNEFSKTGTFSESTLEKLRKTRNYLNSRLGDIAYNVTQRYQELGYEVKVMDLAYYFDWDNDGIAGNEIDESDTVELEQSEIRVPKEGGNYTVKILSDKMYFLVSPSGTADSDSGLDITPPDVANPDDAFDGLYEPGAYDKLKDIQCDKSLDNNILQINVKPAEFIGKKYLTIPVYNARGYISAEVNVIQEGNPDIRIEVPNLGNNGIALVNMCLEYIRAAIISESRLESTYLNNNPKVPFSSNDGSIYDCWSKFYQAINRVLFVKDGDAQRLCCYQPYLNTYLALLYYHMSSHWGGVPYYTEQQSYETLSRIARTNEEELLSSLADMLNEALPMLDEKKNDAFSDANSALFVSKDVARVLLAYIHCDKQDYAQSLPYLEAVIANGFYSLVESNTIEFVNNSECIFGFLPDTKSVDYCQPCLDYKDVILTAAECQYHLGNTSKAEEYLNQLCAAKPFLEFDRTDLLGSISTIRSTIFRINYLPFVRRNGLGLSALGLSESQQYQLLWPIPLNELNYNMNLTQNPGY